MELLTGISRLIFTNKLILELGAGGGLPSIVAAIIM